MIQRSKLYFNKSLLHQTFLNFLVMGSYVALGWSSLLLATINKNSSPFWLPSGLAISCVLIMGRKTLPGIFVGALVTNFLTGTPLLVNFGIGIGNMTEALLGTVIIQYTMERSGLERYSEIFAIAMSALIASVVSATVGVFSMYSFGLISFGDLSYVWYTWWSGDVVGITLTAPLTLSYLYPEQRQRKLSLPLAASLLLLFGFVIYAFMSNLNQAFIWAVCPLFVLLGFACPSLATRWTLLFTSVAIVLLISFGYGPFERGNLNLNYIYVQTLLASYAISVLFARPFDTLFRVGKPFILGNLAGWLSLFVVIFQMTKYENIHLFEDLYKTTDTIVLSFSRNNLQYSHLMDSGEALAKIKRDFSPADWRIFTTAIDFQKQFQGINGYGIISRVKKTELEDFKRTLLRKGVQINRILTFDPDFSRHFEDSMIVSFVEPAINNSTALGIDIGSERTRRKAVEKSLRTKTTVITDPVDLVMNEKTVPGFLILHPVWNGQIIDRWVYAPVILDNYFNQIIESYNDLFYIRVLRGKKVIYQTMQEQTEKWKNDSYLIRRDLHIFDKTFTMEFYPTEAFFNRHSGSSSAMAFLLTLFMLFIIGFLLEQITFGQRAEALVIQRTKELDASKIQLVQSSKMASLGEMASGMAHEINNPLTIITTKLKVLSLMLMDLRDKRPEVFSEIERIQFTADRISKIVRGLKSFSRSAQRDPFELVALREIINETLVLCAEKFKAHGVELEVDEIPNVFINCRSGQITQVLLNLINNSHDAIEALPQKWIKIKFSRSGVKWLHIIVTDSGRGISKEIAERMMEPFFTTKEVGKGTGLGLSIAKGIIDDHGGKLFLNPNSVNTQFIIELPV